MAGRPRKPIELHKIDGKSRLTKAEIEYRERTELKVNLKDVEAPEYIKGKMLDEFWDIANKLLEIGIMTELDSETLGRYLLSKQQYLKLTSMMTKAMSKNDVDKMKELAGLQDKAFKQCRACANDLGLTISSRCRLVLPKIEEPPKNRFVEKFG